jgi:hypothetical protein
MNLFLKNFNKFVAGLIIVLSSTFVFAAGGSNLMAVRDYDASIGLLSRPAKTWSSLAKFFKPLQTEAVGECPPTGVCASEASLKILVTKFSFESAINKLLRNIVMEFVKGMIDFLKKQFNNFLKIVANWSKKVLGLKLNTSHIKRFVGLQSYTQYNLAKGQVNKIFDKTFGPLEDTGDKNALKQTKALMVTATATYEIAETMDTADSSNPGQSNSLLKPNTAKFKTDIIDSLEGILQESCKVNQLSVKPSSSPLEDAVLVSKGVLNKQCLGITSSVNEVSLNLDLRQKEIAKQVTEANSPGNLSLGESDTCGVGIFDTADLSEENSQFEVTVSEGFDASKYGYKSTADFSNPVVASSFGVTEGKTVFGLGRSECELANTAKQNAAALAEVNKKKDAPETESLTDVFFKTLKDFATEIFDSLAKILTKYIDKNLKKITKSISKMGLKQISSPLSKAFGEFRGDINKGLKDQIKDARGEVIKGIDNLQYPPMPSDNGRDFSI